MRKSKILLIVMACVMLFSTTVYAKDMEKLRREIEKEVTKEYNKSIQFQLVVKEMGIEHGEKIINRIVEKKLKKALGTEEKGGTTQLAYADVKNIQQLYDANYCGPANALQAIYGMDQEDSVSGATDAAKQNTLANDMETDASGSIVWKLTRELNEYSGNKQYDFEEGENITLSEFETDVFTSLYYDRAPILHAKTQYISYYNNVEHGHYITIDCISSPDDQVNLCDTYSHKFGDHIVDLDEAWDSIHQEDERYLIYY